MDRKELYASVAALALLASAYAEPAAAQSALGTSVTQSAIKADAATFLAGVPTASFCTTLGAAAANGTITITPPAGNYVYVTQVGFDFGSDTTGSQASVTYTMSGVGTASSGTPAWQFTNELGAAASPVQTNHISEYYPTALKSTAPGTAVVLTPTTNAHIAMCARVAGFFNPN